MKLGIIARGEDRGLGIQTWEACRHLAPAKVLLVDPGERTQGFPIHTERYSRMDTMHTRWENGTLPQRDVHDFIDGLDVIWSAETFYDWRFPDLTAGRPTVLHVNPEFYVHRQPAPTAIWSATRWRLGDLPSGSEVVAHPVDLHRFAKLERPRHDDPILKIIHVVGRTAVADRNGTQIFLDALTQLRLPTRARVYCQGPFDFRVNAVPRWVELHLCGPTRDYWAMYEDAHLIVMPRKFGGLCLPVQEALAAGCAALMTDCSPNEMWTDLRVAPSHSFPLRVPAGTIEAWETDPRTLAAAIDHLNDDRASLARARVRAEDLAMSLDWAVLGPQWLAKMGNLL